jgi:hypothetical protein
VGGCSFLALPASAAPSVSFSDISGPAKNLLPFLPSPHPLPACGFRRHDHASFCSVSQPRLTCTAAGKSERSFRTSVVYRFVPQRVLLLLSLTLQSVLRPTTCHTTGTSHGLHLRVSHPGSSNNRHRGQVSIDEDFGQSPCADANSLQALPLQEAAKNPTPSHTNLPVRYSTLANPRSACSAVRSVSEVRFNANTRYAEVDRAIDNLMKSGKFPMMGFPGSGPRRDSGPLMGGRTYQDFGKASVSGCF